MSKKGFTYTLQIDAEINDLITKTNQVKKTMQSMMDAGKAPGAEKIFTNLEKVIDRLQQKAGAPIESLGDFASIQKDATAVAAQLSKLGGIIENLANMDLADKMDLLPPDLKKKIGDAEVALQSFAAATQQASKKSKELTDAENNLSIAKKELAKQEGRVESKKQLITIQEEAVKSAKEEAKAIETKKAALEKFLKTQTAYEAAGGDKRKAGGGKEELTGMNLPADRKAAQSAAPDLDLKNTQAVQAEIARLGEEYSEASKKVTDAESTQRRYTKQLNEANNAAQLARTKISNLENTVSELNTEFEANKTKDTQAAYNKLRTEAGKLGVDLKNIPIEYTEQNLLELNNVLNQLAVDGIAKVDQNVHNLQTKFDETGLAAEVFGNKMQGAGIDVNNFDTQVKNSEAFTQRIAQFVGLEGGIEIARNAMRNAMETIKELDAAMTEMAVVTNLDVGDYWEQLPEHTQRANELGVSIKSVYEAETLYYQQGLKTNEVIEMSTETLKMARIAGLSAEDATNKMTAALRGFNMELNETSAQRIADVYSELAAITASDVDEISSAMTKTASIAASAGMEFETTAAFLSQIIETTRESAETAGTAMKTVIARFQELKKDPTEIGEVDGEIVDANKIETALRTVGVSLRDAGGQFRELDEVFLELASKWDGLDTNTQRYIATIAAGSRQQSRFIAMMSDYGRTQELVTAANNSAGASQEQYEKTLSSLATALERLSNSWNTFTMSLMDNEVLKAGIDILTALMNAVNGVIEAFDKIGLGSVAGIGMIISALYLGDKALNVFSASIKKGSTIFGAFGQVGRSAIESINKKFKATQILIAKISGKSITLDTKNAEKAVQRYQMALKNEADARDLREEINKVYANNEIARAEKLNALDQIEIANEHEKTAAVAEYAAAQGLTTAQSSVALGLQSLGVSQDLAEMAALGGLTSAKMAEYHATMIASGMGTEEIGIRMGQIAATYAQVGAEKVENTQKKTGIALLWSKVVALGSTIKATIAQTLANWGLQASFWPILVIGLLIVAAFIALAAVIMLVVAAIKALIKNSPEGQLKSAEEAADAAAEAADRAAEAYNNLAESMEGLQDKYKGLEELTRGTKEWKDAVKEVNNEVMDLVEKYPELAAFVKPENTVLKINFEDKEVQKVFKTYEDKAKLAASASYAATINKNEKQAAVRAREIMPSETRSIDLIQNLAIAIESGEVSDNKDSIEAWIKQNGNKNEQLYAGQHAIEFAKITDELREFGRELENLTEQERYNKELMAQNAIGMVDATKYTEEQLKQMDVAATADFTDSFTDKYEEQFDNMESNSDELNKAKEEVAKNLYGEDAKVSGNKITYKDENGDEQTKELTAEEFKEQWAAIQATKDMTVAFKQLPKTINKITSMMTSETGKAFKAMYAGKEGSAMTKADIEAAGTVTEEELWVKWSNLTAEERKAFGTFETMLQQYNDNLKASQDALEQATDESKLAGIELMEGVTMEAARGYAKQMRNLYLLDAQRAKALDTNLRGVMDTLNEADKTKFIGALNALDWKNIESIDSLPATLEEIGVNVPQDELDNYLKHLKDVANATRNIDLAKLKESIVELTSIKKDIGEGDQGRTFSEEAYNALKEMAPELAKDFQLGLDGQYTYLGSSIKNLTKAIEDNTVALLSEAKKQLESKIAMGEAAQALTGTVDGVEYTFAEMASEDFASEDTQKKVLKRYQEMMNNAGEDIIGIEGFGNYSSVDKLKDDELDKIFAQINNITNKMGEYYEELNGSAIETAAMIYQGNTAVQNAQGVNMNANVSEAEFMDKTDFLKLPFKERQQIAENRVNSTRYEHASESQQNEFNARSSALMSQANAAGVNSQMLDNYAKVVAAYKEGKKEYSEVLKVQKELANTTDFLNMKNGLKQVFATASELKEEYDKIASGDVMSKINTANQALAEFGITATDEASADAYMALLDQVTQGNSDALGELIQLAQDAAGLPVKLGNAYTQGWSNLSAEQIAFFDQMQAASMGYWESLEDGTRQFVWASVADLQTAADAAGTAIEEWESPYDWLYNYNETINRQIREREKAERAYTKALEDENSSAADILQKSKEELAILQQQAQMRAAGAERAMQDIQAQFAANAKFSDYVKFDAQTNEILVDYAKLDSAGFDADTGAEFEAFLSAIEENRDTILDAEESLNDIEDRVKEIKDRGKQETSDLYNQIKEGLVSTRQAEIDALQTINDSIQEAQASLVEQMQKQIEEARQARENEKAEESITDKEARLAYLMSDTSGGNALEIAKLQEELANEKTAYSDSLVDQRLQSLQDANEQAAEQRQQQIDIAQQQLDAYTNSALIWQDVQAILLQSQLEAQASDNFAQAWMATEAAQLISVGNGIASLNPIEQEIQAQEMAANAKLSAVYSGVAAMSTAEADAANNLVLSGGLNTLNDTMKSGSDAEKAELLKSDARYTQLAALQTALGSSSPLLSALSSTGAIDKTMVQTNQSINQVFDQLKKDGTLDKSLGGLNTSLKTETEKTTKEVEKAGTKITGVGTAVGTLGSANITPGANSIVAAINGSKGTGSSGTSGKTSGTTSGSSGSSTGTAKSKADMDEKKFNNQSVSGTPDTSKKVEEMPVEAINANWGDGWNVADLIEGNNEESGKVKVGSTEYYVKVIGPAYSAIGEKAYEVGIDQGSIFKYKGNYYLQADANTARKLTYSSDWTKTNSLEKGYNNMIKGLQFKTGGLADFTGPAWLDGTKSKPEIVLNQQDSANFMQLRDILSEVLNGNGKISNTTTNTNGGDNYFDIEINVDSIGNDYDVEQMADKIRSMLYEDATYRNVNALSQ